jgi:hypothetical protein
VLRVHVSLVARLVDVLLAETLAVFSAEHPSVRVEDVPDVNHYTLVMGQSPGPGRVVAAVEASRPC